MFVNDTTTDYSKEDFTMQLALTQAERIVKHQTIKNKLYLSLSGSYAAKCLALLHEHGYSELITLEENL